MLITFKSLQSAGVQKLAIIHNCEQTGFQMACSQHHLGLVTLFLPASQAQFLSYFDMYTAIANLVSGPRPDSLERVCIAATSVIDIRDHQCTETETQPSPWQFQ